MPDYFFDTSVLVAYLKNEDAQSTNLVGLVVTRQKTAAISALTVAEIHAATELDNPTKSLQRKALLALFQVTPLDQSIAENAGLLKRRHQLALPDAIVAATCIQVGGFFYAKDSHFDQLLKQRLIKGTVY